VGVLTDAGLLRPHGAAEEACSDVRRFLAAPAAPVPVWVGARHDLRTGVGRAAGLFSAVAPPLPADVGIDLGTWRSDPRMLVGRCATTWVGLAELPAVLTEDCSVLVVGTYGMLTSEALRSLLTDNPRARVSLLTGRDDASLAWMAAKQWLVPDPEVTRLALVSSAADRLDAPGTLFLGEKELETQDIRRTLLDHRWRAVLFQGHGKDDSINLAEFTICGRNADVAPTGDLLRPRCGYGLPCYKDEAKLIDLKDLRAVTVVLSSCNSGPLSDLALYDPKYQLTLNGVDGTAQTVVSAFTVHDSGEPENQLWARSAGEGRPGDVAGLNASLLQHHPYTSFWRIGLPERPAADPPLASAPAGPTRGSRVLDRCAFYTTTPLLDGHRSLRSRLEHFARRTDTSADTHGAPEPADFVDRSSRLSQDLQSMDYQIARTIHASPDSGVVDFPAYLQGRSTTDPSTTRAIDCVCGAPAVSYTRRARQAAHPDLHCVVCMRCGDRDFRMAGAPVVVADAPDRTPPGSRLAIDVAVSGVTGPVRVGVFVPPYLRPYVIDAPSPHRLVCGLRPTRTRLDITFGDDVPPQAYYFTVYAVHDLALSLHRRHVGIAP
jgi:hypothetical protein